MSTPTPTPWPPYKDERKNTHKEREINEREREVGGKGCHEVGYEGGHVVAGVAVPKNYGSMQTLTSVYISLSFGMFIDM